MTVKEFYEYCVEHGAENMMMKVQYRDGGGYYSGSDEVRQKRANEAAKMQARQIIIDAVDKALELAHAVDLVDTLNELYIDAAEDEEREIMRDE